MGAIAGEHRTPHLSYPHEELRQRTSCLRPSWHNQRSPGLEPYRSVSVEFLCYHPTGSSLKFRNRGAFGQAWADLGRIVECNLRERGGTDRMLCSACNLRPRLSCYIGQCGGTQKWRNSYCPVKHVRFNTIEYTTCLGLLLLRRWYQIS